MMQRIRALFSLPRIPHLDLIFSGVISLVFLAYGAGFFQLRDVNRRWPGMGTDAEPLDRIPLVLARGMGYVSVACFVLTWTVMILYVAWRCYFSR